MNEATHIHCDRSGAQEGEDNATHHLVPRADGMTCSWCRHTPKQIETHSEVSPNN